MFCKLTFLHQCTIHSSNKSCLAQRKRAGLITRRTSDRNREQLALNVISFFAFSMPFILFGSWIKQAIRRRREMLMHAVVVPSYLFDEVD